MTHTVGPLGAPIKDGPEGSSNKKNQIRPSEDDVIQIQSRSMSDPSLSDIDFKSKMPTPGFDQ